MPPLHLSQTPILKLARTKLNIPNQISQNKLQKRSNPQRSQLFNLTEKLQVTTSAKKLIPSNSNSALAVKLVPKV